MPGELRFWVWSGGWVRPCGATYGARMQALRVPRFYTRGYRRTAPLGLIFGAKGDLPRSGTALFGH